MPTGSSSKQDGPWNQKDFVAASVLTLGTHNVALLPLEVGIRKLENIIWIIKQSIHNIYDMRQWNV